MKIYCMLAVNFVLCSAGASTITSGTFDRYETDLNIQSIMQQAPQAMIPSTELSFQISAGVLSVSLHEAPPESSMAPVEQMLPQMPNCNNGVTISDPSTSITTLNFLKFLDAKGKTGTMQLRTFDGSKSVRWIYASAPVRIQGRLSCSTFEMDIQLSLNAGWNHVYNSNSMINGNMVMQEYSSDLLPSNLNWVIEYN